jgi:hypothetical protein
VNIVNFLTEEGDTGMADNIAKMLGLDTFIRELESGPLAIDEFDERIFTVAVDTVTVLNDDWVRFRFKDGTKVW